MNIQEIKLKWNAYSDTLHVDVNKKGIIQEIDAIIPEFIKTYCKELFSVGGKRICLPYSYISDVDSFITRSKLIEHTGIIKVEGRSLINHRNCAEIWIKNPNKYQLVAGHEIQYNVWHSHTWLQNKEMQIIETAQPSEKYFGAALDTEESLRFCSQWLQFS